MASTTDPESPAAKKPRPSCAVTNLKPGIVIQGGTKPKKAKLLKEQLDAAAADDKAWEAAFLFPNDQGEYDGTAFGGPITKDATEFDDLRVKACKLPDPTIEDKWWKVEVMLFFNYCDQAWVSYSRGATVGIACVGGNNRSKAMAYALTKDPDFKPTCPALQAVAEAYINGQDPTTIPVPIFASPATSLRSRAK